MTTHVNETWKGNPVNQFQKLPGSEFQLELIWKSYYKHVHTDVPNGWVCSVHMCKPDISYCFVAWSLGQNDFPTPLQSQNFKLSLKVPTSQSFKK